MLILFVWVCLILCTPRQLIEVIWVYFWTLVAKTKRVNNVVVIAIKELLSVLLKNTVPNGTCAFIAFLRLLKVVVGKVNYF